MFEFEKTHKYIVNKHRAVSAEKGATHTTGKGLNEPCSPGADMELLV